MRSFLFQIDVVVVSRLFVAVELSSTGLPLFHPVDMKIKYRKEIKIKFFLFFVFFFLTRGATTTLSACDIEPLFICLSHQSEIFI